MRRLGDNPIEHFLQCVDALTRDGIFVVHQMHLVKDVIVVDLINDIGDVVC